MLVTIANCGDGKCVWCQTTGEGVQATFKDGIAGFFCCKHLWEALKARAETKENSSAVETATTSRKA